MHIQVRKYNNVCMNVCMNVYMHTMYIRIQVIMYMYVRTYVCIKLMHIMHIMHSYNSPECKWTAEFPK